MGYSTEDLDAIFAKSGGACHLCGEGLVRAAYGRINAPGGWQVDHSKAKANGGTNHPNNLWAACPPCNQQKGTGRARDARAAVAETRNDNALAGCAVGVLSGAAAGAAVGGLPGAVIGGLAGALFGAVIGHQKDPRKPRSDRE